MRKHLLYVIPLLFLGGFDIAHAEGILGSLVSFSADTLGYIASFFIYMILLPLASFITMLGGVLLNAAVHFSVVDMSANMANLPAINTAWTVIRDIANMGFIFVLLYTAIMTIFGQGNYRETIKNVIIAALLINFSLFFTKIIIDAANLLALTFYEAIAPGAVASKNFLNAGISNAIVEPLGIQTLFKAAGGFSGQGMNLAITGILGSLVLLISGFIFFAMAIMFVIRYVILVFVLILSPIAFVAEALPGMKDYSKKWWKALLNQSFFAPVFFVLMWVTILVVKGIVAANLYSNGQGAAVADWSTGLGGALKTTTSGTSFNYESGMIATILNFAVIIVFLVASLIISKEMAEKSADGAKKLVSTALGYAGGATFGVAGRFGRGTFGRLGQTVADSETLKNRAAQGGILGRAARLSLATGKKTAGASFDVRGIEALGKNLDAGKPLRSGKDGGFAGDMKAKAKEEKEFADSLKPSPVMIDQAKRDVQRAKDAGDKEAQKTAEARLAYLQGNKDEVKKQEESIEKKKQARIAEIRDNEELKEAQNRRDAMRDRATTLKTEMAAEKDADKRANLARQLEEANKILRDETEAVKTLQKVVNKAAEAESATYDAQKAGIEKIKGIGDKRKETFTERTLDNPGFNIPGVGKYDFGKRHLFGFGNVKKEYQAAAAEIRKEKKSVKDQLEDILKSEGELKDDKKPDAGAVDEKPKEEKKG